MGLLLLARALTSVSGGGWQQEVAYRVSASLDEAAAALRGRQSIHYRNRSPDSLGTIVLRLDLNAFRPGSRWARVEAQAGNRRIEALREPDFGFARVHGLQVEGSPVALTWPHAPDSTVARVVLPRALAPGDSTLVTMEWEVRPSIAIGGQGHSGRHYDLPLWFPRVGEYGRSGWVDHPLWSAAAFSGEFGRFLVELDVPADQVVGATGVAVCGDPGWAGARRPRGGRVVDQRRYYRAARDPDVRALIEGTRPCPTPLPGRKILVWYAEDVPHFAMAMDPEFRYEEGDVFERPVRVLYRPGSERTWGAGLASGRAETALVWLDEILGPYPWPQLTLVETLSDGGRGLPMMVMSGGQGGSAQRRILNAVGHNYVPGIISNDDWNEPWLSGGLNGIQVTWFFETIGQVGSYHRLEREVLDWDIDRLAMPIAQPRDRFPDSATEDAMTSWRAELFFHQLRYLAGDNGMRRILRTYAAENRFRRGTEEALRRIAEAEVGRDLGAFFDQWLRQSNRQDFKVRRAARVQRGDQWQTTVTVTSAVAGQLPAEVWVYGQLDTGVVRLSGRGREEEVVVTTRSRPVRVTVDPRAVGHDWNMLNNHRGFGLRPGKAPTERYLGGWFGQRVRRDRLTSGVSPTAWYNDAGGWTLGLRRRNDYLGRFSRDETWLSFSTGWSDRPKREFNGRVVFRNPTALTVPGLDHWYEAGLVEGRGVVGVGFVKRNPRILAPAGPVSWGVQLQWLGVIGQGRGYLDPGQWSNAATAELTGSVTARGSGWAVAGRVAGGRVTGGDSGVARQAFGRFEATATGARDLGSVRFRARAFLAAAVANDPLPRQRRVFLAGADPYQRFSSPFLRSRGALFARDGVRYHEPGGANVRGLDPAVAASHGFGLNVEVEQAVLRQPGQGSLRRVAIALFGDGAWADGDVAGAGGNRLQWVADGGVGLRLDHRIGATTFQTRLDLPLWINRPDLAQGSEGGRLGWRWLVSFRPSW